MATEKVKSRLRELEQATGRLTPADVVADARDPASPLHGYFEWDDSVAGEKYREHQARALIRSVKVEIMVRDVPLSVVGYVRDPEAESGEPGYRNVMRIRSEEDQARAVIVDEMKRVADAVKRARALAFLLGVDGDVERIAELAAVVSDRVATMPEARA